MRFVFLVLLCVVGVALVWLATTYLIGSYRFGIKLAELRAAGQPVSVRDLAREPIPARSNAATYLSQAHADLKAIEKLIMAAEQDPAVRKLKQAGKTETEIDLSGPMLEVYRQAIESHPDVWPLLEQAAACPSYQPQLDYTTDGQTFLSNTLPIIGQPRSAARALRYRALLLLSEGKREQALDCCLTMLRLTRRFDQSPTLVGFMVAIAIRSLALDTTNLVLRSGPLPQRSYDALAQELDLHDLPQAFEHALVTERALGLQMWDEMGFAFAYKLLPAGREDRLSYFDLFDAATAWAASPYSDTQARADLETAEAQAGALTALLAPAIEATAASVARAQAKLRALRVLCAILTHEQSGQPGEVKLADLGLPAEVTTDPFNDQPLHAQKTADGWLIYSVGADLKDDGGQLDDKGTDVGMGPLPPFAGTAQGRTDGPAEP